MASTQAPLAQGEACPDPSAHGRMDPRLQDQASKAALYVTHPHPETNSGRDSALDAEGKLSSASAAASLKHAKPHELPSFPVVGIDTAKSGNMAANLAHSNQKSFEHWKPGDLSASAGKAASIAHKDGGKLDLWMPSASEPGHTAASLAMLKQSGLAPQIDYGYTDDGHKKALLAATLSVKGRGRSGSVPAANTAPRYPDAENASANALNAAAIAHKPTVRKQSPYRVSSPANEAARLTHMQGNINRDMFTEHPPISVESEEQRKRKAALKGATLAHTRQVEDAAAQAKVDANPGRDPMTYAKNHLKVQEQAQKLAQEKLNKLDPDGARAYREHYGYASPHRSRLSMRNRRTRSSSEGNRRRVDSDDEDDAKRAGRIRHQMSRFNNELSTVDTKRQTDRSTLMAAAEKSVKQRMSTMDQQIFNETGKVTPGVMEQWEAKARARAAERSEKRLETHGLVNIGGGKFMEEKEVEAIAAGRMQPTLDEITANAEKQRERDEQIRLDQEKRREEAARDKERGRATKAEVKQAKQEEKELAKTHKRLQKEEQRQHKEAIKEQDIISHDVAKQREATSKRSTDDKRSTEQPRKTEETAAGPAIGGASASEMAAKTSADKPKASEDTQKPRKLGGQKLTKGERSAMGATVHDPPGVPTNFEGERSEPHPELEHTTSVEENPEVQKYSGPAGVSFKRNDKRDSRVRSWLGKLKRSNKHERTDSHESGSTATTTAGSKEGKESKEGKQSGEGGLYTHFKEAPREEDKESSGAMMSGVKGKGAKERSISPATPTDSTELARGRTTSNDDEFEEAKDKFDEGDLKIPEIPAGRTSLGDGGSPARTSSKFMEEL